ncbi:MAG: hypothetical protein AVDCRST_MAG59-4296 [uncultured Thermomicrobiales bacterium]|uniref:Uncharacterized protein n=1 Tax=uncultured Thermomicrobiales bacterium TaxID=1645740 RepID=A0A6J4VJ45_9BACT|nr:MAG: hypothetical protein AVDCRST_MAG59-4296 [uncultured Thermomicrobiales bacterium]
MRRQERSGRQPRLEREVGGVAAFAMEDDVAAFRERLRDPAQLAWVDAEPTIVQLGPSRDAVKIALPLDLRQAREGRPGEARRTLDQAPDSEGPGSGVERRHLSLVEHRPPLRRELPRRQRRRVGLEQGGSADTSRSGDHRRSSVAVYSGSTSVDGFDGMVARNGKYRRVRRWRDD